MECEAFHAQLVSYLCQCRLWGPENPIAIKGRVKATRKEVRCRIRVQISQHEMSLLSERCPNVYAQIEFQQT